MKTVALKRKSLLSFIGHAVLAMGLIGLLPAPAKAWLYYSAPPIQGTITDATTGKPIENAVLVVEWVKLSYAVLHPQHVVTKKMYVATDKNGVYRIPSFWSIHLLSKFSSVTWAARHPLYSTVQRGIGRAGIDVLTQPDRKAVGEETDVRNYASLGASGEIVFNFKLLSLSEKFKEKPSTGDFRGELSQEFLYEGPEYFSTSRQLGLTVSVDAIFKEWDEIAGRFSDVEYVQSSWKSGKEKIAKILSKDETR